MDGYHPHMNQPISHSFTPRPRPLRAGWLALSLAAAVFAVGCAAPVGQAPTSGGTATVARDVRGLLPADVLLLGEQHDSPEHHAIERAVVEQLAKDGKLAVLALEMSDYGNTTAALPKDASEDAVRERLRWNEKGWPWASYGPAVMAAVRHGVTVVGANLPRERMRDAMAEAALDVQLAGPALKAQQQAVREGHCNLLPESQIAPMTRIQIARDRSMARTLAQEAQKGRTAVLITGSAHADKALGVPQHLPVELKVKSVRMQAGAPRDRDPAVFDAIWPTPALPEKDYCKDVVKR